MLRDEKVRAGLGYSTVVPDFDFETYSEAGYYFEADKWRPLDKNSPGIFGVGSSVYTEHPSAEVLSLAYDLKDGLGRRLWIPGMADPYDIFDYLRHGGLIEAWNSQFEYEVWKNICVPRLGWPELPLVQLRDAAAKSRAHCLPGALGKAAKAAGVQDLKIDDGKRLIRKFSVPRTPTKHDRRLRVLPIEEPKDGQKLYEYNIGDIITESQMSTILPDLSPQELDVWLLDQKINQRGMYIDREALNAFMDVIRQAQKKYTEELIRITGGDVQTISELDKMKVWLSTRGVYMSCITKETVPKKLKEENLDPQARRVLELRQILGSSSVLKAFSLDRRISKDGRMRGMLIYHEAITGRWAGRGPQPQNLPNGGPQVKLCVCSRYYRIDAELCPTCLQDNATAAEWCFDAVEQAKEILATRDLKLIEYIYGDPLTAVSGCLRSLFSAAPGKDLICSDYSAIEAVVLAALAGEEWRLEVFRTHGMIYEKSASKISGIPFEDFIKYKKEHGSHHPLRKKLGKPGELGSQYGGSYGAWCNFGADKFLSKDEIIKNVKLWRKASPNIVKFWYGLQDAAIAAVQQPGKSFGYRDIKYGMSGDALYCLLPSGRKITYHQPRLHPDVTPWGKECFKLSYMRNNTDKKKGHIGWARIDTWGGKLCENVVQAVARDILAYALVNLEGAGYPIVLHVHDEVVCEVDRGFGSIEEFESIMATLPEWCKGWPLKASGGWRGKCFRKD